MNKKQVLGVIAACAALLITGLLGVFTANSVRTGLASLSSLFGSAVSETALPQEAYIGVVPIEGTIGASENYYRGQIVAGSAVDWIDTYKNDRNNEAILLYIDSTGGAVNETDEIYLALMDYKNTTGRPVYAWCGDYCASGAYYIACAADRIAVNRNTWIGSIGVYIQSVNYAELMKKLGIEGVYIRSSENKAMGNVYDHLTDEQYAIYQGLVDEAYEQFLSIVAKSRGFDKTEADDQKLRAIADGRVYTASQGLATGLAANIESYDETVSALGDLCGAEAIYTPDPPKTSVLDQLLSSVSSALPRSELQTALEAVEKAEVKLYYALF